MSEVDITRGGYMDTFASYSGNGDISVKTADGGRLRMISVRGEALAPSDLELLSACRAGDQGAWELLVERYERLVFSVALRNGVTREEAADITQMTFIALLESIGKLREDQRLASWLMSVARRLAWRQRRRSDRECLGVERMTWPEDPIAEWERIAVVHEGLMRLGRACRDLLLALYFDPASPSYAIIAERFGRSIGGIGPMRARCLQRLRVLLGEDACRET
jgi:RNA polymerase sigma factor (sigma-70 family)